MKTSEFVHTLDHALIVQAIEEAEQKTSGEIRVFVSKKHQVDDPVHQAEKEFHRLGMDRTQLRNGVLLFVAPLSQTFAIIGDRAVHEHCGQSFWAQVAEAMLAEFRQHRFTEGLVLGIHEAAKVMAEHFPRRPDDVNELPNTVEEG